MKFSTLIALSEFDAMFDNGMWRRPFVARRHFLPYGHSHGGATGKSDAGGGGVDTGDHDGDEQYGSDRQDSRRNGGDGGGGGGVETGDHDGDEQYGSDRQDSRRNGGDGGGGGVETGDHDGDEQYGRGREPEDPGSWRDGSGWRGGGGGVETGDHDGDEQYGRGREPEDPGSWRDGSGWRGGGGGVDTVDHDGDEQYGRGREPEDPGSWRDGSGVIPEDSGAASGGNIIIPEASASSNGSGGDGWNPPETPTPVSTSVASSETDVIIGDPVEAMQPSGVVLKNGEVVGAFGIGVTDSDDSIVNDTSFAQPGDHRDKDPGTHTLEDGGLLVVTVDSNGNRIETLYPADYRYKEGYDTGRSILTITRPNGSTVTQHLAGGEFVSERKYNSLTPPVRVFEDIILVDLARVDETSANWGEQASQYRDLATRYESDDRTNEFQVVDKDTGETVPVTEWLHQRIEQAEKLHAEETADNAAFYKSYVLATAPLEGDPRPPAELVRDIDATVENLHTLLANTEGQHQRDFITGEITRLETERESKSYQAEFQADLQQVADGKAWIQNVLAKWEADPRSDGMMLQVRGELLHGEDAGDYYGPPGEISAVDWLRAAAAEDTAWRERSESRQNEQSQAFAALKADLQRVEDGEETLQNVLAKWEADPRSDGMMLQVRGELLSSEEVGDYYGPPIEISAVDWLREAAAQDTAWRERSESRQNEQSQAFAAFQADLQRVEGGEETLQNVLAKLEADPHGKKLMLQVRGESLHGEEVGDYYGPPSEISAVEWLRQTVAEYQSTPEYNRMLIEQEVGGFDPALGITSTGRFNAGLATPVGIGDMQAAADRIAYREWLARRDAPQMELGPYQGPAPTTDSYGGSYSRWLDADGNQVRTEAEATYRIDGAGPDAVIVGVRPRKEIDDSPPGRLDSVAKLALLGLQARNLGAAQKADELAGQMQYGPHHGKHPSEVLGPSDQHRLQEAWVREHLVGRKLDRWGNIQYAADLNGPYENTATPLGNVTGVNDDGSLKLADPSQVFALNASHAKIEGINPDGTVDLNWGSAGRWAERVGGYVPGFSTLHGVATAYDPASPDGSRWSADEKIGIAKHSALDAFYLTGAPFGGISMARSIATGGSRALLANPVRHIIRPLFVNSSFPMTSMQIAGQVGNVGRAAYQGGGWAVRGASGQGFTVAPGFRGVVGHKLVDIGRGIRSESGEELVETPYEGAVTWALTGTPEFNSPLAVAGNVLTFGPLEAASRGRRRGPSGPAQTYGYDLPTSPYGAPDRFYHKTPSGLWVPTFAGGRYTPDSSVPVSGPLNGFDYSTPWVRPDTVRQHNGGAANGYHSGLMSVSPQVAPESSVAVADPSEGFDHSDQWARQGAMVQHDDGRANWYRSGLMSVAPQVAPEWSPFDPDAADGWSQQLIIASPPVLTPYEEISGFTETSSRPSSPPQKPPAPPGVDDPGSSGREPTPAPPAPPVLYPIDTPIHSQTPSLIDEPLIYPLAPTIMSPHISETPNVATPSHTFTPPSPTAQPLRILSPSVLESPGTTGALTPIEPLASPGTATHTLASPGTATGTATTTAPTPSPSAVAGTTPGIATTPTPIEESHPPTPRPTLTPTPSPTPTPSSPDPDAMPATIIQAEEGLYPRVIAHDEVIRIYQDLDTNEIVSEPLAPPTEPVILEMDDTPPPVGTTFAGHRRTTPRGSFVYTKPVGKRRKKASRARHPYLRRGELH